MSSLDLLRTVIATVVMMIAIPCTVYFSVKMGTYAFFRGRQIFHHHNTSKGN